MPAFRLLCWCVATLVLGSVLGAPMAARADTSLDVSDQSQPLGLMVSLSLWANHPSGSLTSWMEYVCRTHAPGSGPGAVNSLVVEDLAAFDISVPLTDTSGQTADDALYTGELNELLPYFPGGHGACTFPQVYVGALELSDHIANPYTDGVQDKTITANVVARSAAVARKFAPLAAAAGVSYGWYVNWEGLPDLWNGTSAWSIEKAYLSFLENYSGALAAVTPNVAFLWSPGFNAPESSYTPAQVNQISIRIHDLFSNYLAWASAQTTSTRPGQFVLDMQDHVGDLGFVSGCGPMLPVDAVAWYELLVAQAPGVTVQMNVEQFKRPSGSTCGSTPLESGYGSVLADRENYYASRGVLIGPSYELSFWQGSNHQTEGIPTSAFADAAATPNIVNGVLTTKVQATISNSLGSALAGASVELLTCDSTGGLCLSTSPVTTASTDQYGHVTIDAPANELGSDVRIALGGTAVYWPSESVLIPVPLDPTSISGTASPAAFGGASTVSGVLNGVEGPVGGATVSLSSCSNAACASPTLTSTGITSASGAISLDTNALTTFPVYVQLRFAGDALHDPSSTVLAVRGKTVVSVRSATTSVNGTLTAAGFVALVNGGGLSSLTVIVQSCPSLTSCSAPITVGTGTTDASGDVTVAALAAASYIRLQFAGGSGYSPGHSAIVPVATP